MFHSHSGADGAIQNRRHNLAGAFAVAALLCVASAAHADITYHPTSLIDHGSYITDTVQGLDWYKFDNAVTTVGLTYDDAVATFAGDGWGAASYEQVSALQSQFGWVSDTPWWGVTPNVNLTSAMAGYLGFTSVDFYFEGRDKITQSGIFAMTSDYYYFPGQNLEGYQVTMSASRDIVDVDHQIYFQGDYVNGYLLFVESGVTNAGFGTWLSRPTAPVPEPATWAMLMLGLGGLLVKRQRLG